MSVEQAERGGRETLAAPDERGGPAVWAYLIPNALSASRLVLAVLFPLVSPAGRVVAVLGALVSDLLDGYLARRWNATSTFGRMLDPIADKAFALTVLATLVAEGAVSWPAAILLALRDVTVLAGSAWLVARRDWPALCRLTPNGWGKAATNVIFTYLLLLVAGVPYSGVLFPIAAALSGAAAVRYAWGFLRPR